MYTYVKNVSGLTTLVPTTNTRNIYKFKIPPSHAHQECGKSRI